MHIQNCKRPKEAWDSLQAAFEDSELIRKLGLMRTLITMQSKNCSNVEVYIMSTSHNFNELKFEIKDE